jgi:cell division initiation protein
MSLIPINIKTKEFSTSFRGFNRAEVKEYLNKLASEVDDLLIKNENLLVEAGELSLKLADFKTLENELKTSLDKAKENAVKNVGPSKIDSNQIIREAELKAAQIINRAKENANEIRNAVLTLREQKELIIAKLKAMVETQAGLFENKIVPGLVETDKTKKQQSNENIDVDVDDIVNKIL